MRVAVVIVGCVLMAAPVPCFAMNWECTYQQVNDHHLITGQYTDRDGRVLDGPINDYSGKRPRYEIVEDTEDGLIAIQHFSNMGASGHQSEMGLLSVILNKKNGRFKLLGARLHDPMIDEFVGRCTQIP
jgi:hypothetical protein